MWSDGGGKLKCETFTLLHNKKQELCEHISYYV